jgi:ADP-ribose pyrophosphatase YjhB (NUDIX family)
MIPLENTPGIGESRLIDASRELTMHFHPKPDDEGKQVAILHPSQPSPISCWEGAKEAATVVPDGSMPDELNGISFQPWQAPTSDEEWAAVEGQANIDEPPFTAPPGKHAAAGVVVIEPDGRVWLVAPTNAFGGYKHSFPKGRPGTGASLQTTAIREAFEESGLKVRITGYLGDFERTTSFTRLYLAERVGGDPTAMGWESQAVRLVPQREWAAHLQNPSDQPVLAALLKRFRQGE